ncbi:MAG: hypothetical protein AAF725_10160 [Acidobacteriota bacterium]
MSEEPSTDLLGGADDVDLWIERIYGASARSARLPGGLLHPTSVWRPRRDGQWSDLQLALRIGAETPVSWHDAFALNLCRARADAIVTTGRILRAEKNLRHDLGGPGSMPQALAAWRRERLAKANPPVSLVLTRGGEIDLQHPFFRNAAGRVVVYTSRPGAWRLESRAADAGVEVEAVDEPTPQGAIHFLRAAFGAATMSLEAGPSVARALYRPRLEIDELLLSTFLGDGLPTSVRGGRQLERSAIDRLMKRASEPFLAESKDGSWQLERWVRRR